MTKFYTGVGSRSTPQEVLEQMGTLAGLFPRKGYTLRSGGAQGADLAFEEAAGTDAVIYYAGTFMDKRTYERYDYTNAAYDKAMEIAQQSHPAWNRCSEYARMLHTRNVFQVLGHHLEEPSTGMICWTQDGAELPEETSIKTGGTGTAIRIAGMYGVKVLNLARPNTFEAIYEGLTE